MRRNAGILLYIFVKIRGKKEEEEFIRNIRLFLQ